MRERILEDVKGVGAFYVEDQSLGSLRYHVRLTVGLIGPDGEEGLKRLEGAVVTPSDQAWLLLPHVRKECRLHLEDGRWFNCWLKDSNGRLAPRGEQGLYRETSPA